MSKKKNKKPSKQFKLLVYRRTQETGESYSVAKLYLERERVDVEMVGLALTHEGRLVPRREIRLRRDAPREQLYKAIFGPQWRPPTQRCPKCHTWITHDGFCICNEHERPADLGQTVTIIPEGAGLDDEMDEPTRRVRDALQQWIDLPEVVPSTAIASCYLAAAVGCLVCSAEAAEASGLYIMHPLGPDRIALGDIRLEVEGGWQKYRLPFELGWWAAEQVEAARLDENNFPAYFSLVETDAGYDVHVSSLRAGR